MLGHRGVRLGITYPEITEMQVRAILEAAGELIKAGKKALPEIMIPVTCAVTELNHQKAIVDRVYAETCKKLGLKKIPYMYGTMIEIPRAALQAASMAETAEFFTFGTNDLTQMSFGFSRDDIGSFLPDYLTDKILPGDPFQTHRPGRHRRADPVRHRPRPLGQARPQGRHLRRARRRPRQREVLPRGRDELRQLLTVPRADRPLRRGPGLDQEEGRAQEGGQEEIIAVRISASCRRAPIRGPFLYWTLSSILSDHLLIRTLSCKSRRDCI